MSQAIFVLLQLSSSPTEHGVVMEQKSRPVAASPLAACRLRQFPRGSLFCLDECQRECRERPLEEI